MSERNVKLRVGRFKFICSPEEFRQLMAFERQLNKATFGSGAGEAATLKAYMAFRDTLRYRFVPQK